MHRGHCGIQKALEMINISDIYLDIIKDRISKIQEFFYEEIIEDPRKFLNSFLAFAFDAGPIFGAETPVHPPKIRRNFTVQKQYFYETFPDFLLNSYF